MKSQLEKRAADTYDRLTHPHSSNNFLPGLVLGLAVGAIAGLLLAPKTGEDLIKDLSEGYDDLKSKASGWINDSSEVASDLKNKASGWINDATEGAKHKFEETQH